MRRLGLGLGLCAGAALSAPSDSVAFSATLKKATAAFFLAEPPVLVSTNVQIVSTKGGSTITATGLSLGGATGVTYGGVACTGVSSTATTVTFTTSGAIGAGMHDVIVTTASGASAALSGVLEAWYPSQISSEYNVTDAEIGIVTTIAPPSIDSAADQSGNANNLTGITNEKPTLVASVFGSRHSIRTTHAQELRLGSHKVQATGFTHWAVIKTTSTTVAGDYNTGDVLFANYPSPAYNTWGYSSGFLDYVQFNGSIFVHDQKLVSIADGLAHLILITHDHVSGDVKQYVDGVQCGSTVTRAYNTGNNGWTSYANSDGAGHVGDTGIFGDGPGVIGSSDHSKLRQFCVSTLGTL